MIQTVKNNVEPDYQLGAEKFCYWLQGFFEMTKAETMTPEQVKMVKDHLHLVFTHKVIIPPANQFQPGPYGATAAGVVEALTTIC